MGERLKPAVCKIAALTGYAGSNPAPSTSEIELTPDARKGEDLTGRPASGAKRAHIAQLVEHALGKGEVTGSSPVVGSIALAVPSGADAAPLPSEERAAENAPRRQDNKEEPNPWPKRSISAPNRM